MKNKFRGVILFVAGILTASILQTNFSNLQEALADQYACIRQDLDARLMNGNIPSQKFTIVYAVPSCFAGNGYKISNTYIYQDTMVAVTYTKPTPAVGVQGVMPSTPSGGGFQPVP